MNVQPWLLSRISFRRGDSEKLVGLKLEGLKVKKKKKPKGRVKKGHATLRAQRDHVWRFDSYSQIKSNFNHYIYQLLNKFKMSSYYSVTLKRLR